jgi:hypothetical protein
VPDHDPHQSAPDPPAPPSADALAPELLPSLAHDLAVVAWLHGSRELSGDTTGYLCDALLQWTLLDGTWPEPAEPATGPAGGHLDVLAQLHDRWLQRALLEPIGRRLELATVGRLLGTALRCQRDPHGLADARRRERLHLQPALAGPPAPYVLADGRVL